MSRITMGHGLTYPVFLIQFPMAIRSTPFYVYGRGAVHDPASMGWISLREEAVAERRAAIPGREKGRIGGPKAWG